MAQDTRYRVEILLLTHLRHVEPPAEADQIPDYSAAIDFLTPEPEPEEGDRQEEAAATAAQQEISPEEQADELLEPEEPDPNAVVHIEEMSDVMREAWRRLRLSAPFRPQQYLSWEQGNQEPFPLLRIHDLEVVMTKDPHARERLKIIEADLLESESERLEAERAERELLLAASSGGAQEPPAEDSELSTEPEFPPFSQYYRLDGTVTLRRSRFLHLEFNIQWREGEWEPEPLMIVSQDPVIYERAGPTAFQVYELVQSRQVKSGRMEYFDGPVLSALAFITAIEVNDEAAP